MLRRIQRQALVGCSVAQMYALVTDIPSYPKFLPWCVGASVIDEKLRTGSGTVVVAHLDLAWGPIRYRLVTRNDNEPPGRVSMHLVRGPLDRLDGTWTFEPGEHGSTQVALDLSFTLAHRMTGLFVAPLISEALETLTDAFVAEAGRRYGSDHQLAD
ncbi:MAG: type II toxin-antitoxin system RatA family toxin [Gammaproteobacteria bacterium]